MNRRDRRRAEAQRRAHEERLRKDAEEARAPADKRDMLKALPEAGGLISYGTSLTEMYRQLGVYAGRVLKGRPTRASSA